MSAPVPNPKTPPMAAPADGCPPADPIIPPAAAPRRAPMPAPFSRVVSSPPEHPHTATTAASSKPFSWPCFKFFIRPSSRLLEHHCEAPFRPDVVVGGL